MEPIDRGGAESEKNAKRGRAAFVPTDEHRSIVRSMAAAGATRSEMAERIGISLPTLRSAFADELADRPDDAQSSLFDEAVIEAVQATPAVPKRRPGSGGRKKYRPTSAERDKVSLLAATGQPFEAIGRVLGISVPTLRRAFKAELETAISVKMSEVLLAMHKSAMSGNVQAQTKLLERFDRAALAKISEGMTKTDDTAPTPPKQPALGKKEQALQGAADVALDSEWSGLLGGLGNDGDPGRLQ